MLTDRVQALTDPWGAIADLIILLTIAAVLWKAAVWVFQAARGIGKEVDHYDKSHLFFAGMPPNGAPTLWERAEQNEADHVKLFACLEEVNTKLDGLVEAKPNGRRKYDPHE